MSKLPAAQETTVQETTVLSQVHSHVQKHGVAHDAQQNRRRCTEGTVPFCFRVIIREVNQTKNLPLRLYFRLRWIRVKLCCLVLKCTSCTGLPQLVRFPAQTASVYRSLGLTQCLVALAQQILVQLLLQKVDVVARFLQHRHERL